jgi:molybdenum cofactor cytidylyltransferase
MAERAESIEGVILAAGLSTRMRPYKMALPLGDKTVIASSVESMVEFVDRILVVVGWQAAQVQKLLVPYAKVRCVFNADYRSGMFSSVKAGLAQVQAARVFVLPGDHPLIGPQVYARMLALDDDIVIPTFQGRKGHPVLLRGGLVPEILAQPADSTLRDYIGARGYATVEVADPGICMDVDSPQDYERLQRRTSQ